MIVLFETDESDVRPYATRKRIAGRFIVGEQSDSITMQWMTLPSNETPYAEETKGWQRCPFRLSNSILRDSSTWPMSCSTASGPKSQSDLDMGGQPSEV